DPADIENYMFIHLRERNSLDTDAVPEWWIAENDLLRDAASDTRVAISLNPDDDGSGETPTNVAHPVIGYTLAIPGRDQLFIHFSEPVQNAGGGALGLANFDFSAGTEQSLDAAPGGTPGQDWILRRDTSFTPAELAAGVNTITGVNIESQSGDASATELGHPTTDRSTHRISDLFLVSEDAQAITPVFANEVELSRDPDRGGTGLIRRFDGSEYLQPRDIRLQAFANVGSLTDLWFDSEVPSERVSNGLWLPPFDETDFSGLVPFPNTSAEDSSFTSVGGNLLDVTIPGSSDKLRNGTNLEFFLRVGGGAPPSPGTPPLYAARVENPDSSTWFRSVRPFSFRVQDVLRQRGGVSIANNVINPDRGERAELLLRVENAGTFTINVFNLAGDLIDVLHRGRLDAGEHTTTWDGTNRTGRIVARGLYFIRVVGPGIDEYRQVMVVR
ncbi:MAG: FlgD immunoglobulin-like domain containing protein, partial [bacterium]